MHFVNCYLELRSHMHHFYCILEFDVLMFLQGVKYWEAFHRCADMSASKYYCCKAMGSTYKKVSITSYMSNFWSNPQ